MPYLRQWAIQSIQRAQRSNIPFDLRPLFHWIWFLTQKNYSLHEHSAPKTHNIYYNRIGKQHMWAHSSNRNEQEINWKRSDLLVLAQCEWDGCHCKTLSEIWSVSAWAFYRLSNHRQSSDWMCWRDIEFEWNIRMHYNKRIHFQSTHPLIKSHSNGIMLHECDAYERFVLFWFRGLSIYV